MTNNIKQMPWHCTLIIGRRVYLSGFVLNCHGYTDWPLRTFYLKTDLPLGSKTLLHVWRCTKKGVWFVLQTAILRVYGHFFFLVESKNNHTKMEIPILIQGFYKFLCMFRWRWPSLSHILSMLFKKQNELVRLCIIYWCSNCSSLKFTEDFGWPTSK